MFLFLVALRSIYNCRKKIFKKYAQIELVFPNYLKVIIGLEKIFMNVRIINFDLANQEREFVRELSRKRQFDCISPVRI
jgi:hypothetical protein